MENTESSKKIEQELQWIQPVEYEHPISDFERFKRRMLRNPFVPIGTLATVAALTIGIRSMLRGDSKNSQLMMRFRVGFQGATVTVLLLGLYVEALMKNKDDH